MYWAPKGYHVISNVLPLEQRITKDETGFDCVPCEGEGNKYLHETRIDNNLDWGVYCA